MASLIVQKYGGSSLAKPEQIQSVANRIADLHARGHQLIIVVSAMGKTTDQLLDLAYQVSPTPNRRELDMLLTTGERISMALMSMALNDRNCPSISFTGSQAGVLTDDQHSNARIIDVKPMRVEATLDRRQVVVLAGFQGVSPKSKEVTTLGRGGSDTTAVAMAAVFNAERCEIRKDVDGVHSADPNTVAGTEHLAHLSYAALLEMTYWGAKVLHYRSVELATVLKIPVLIALAHGDADEKSRRTLIQGETQMYEQARILSVNSHRDARWLTLSQATLALGLQELEVHLKHVNLPMPQFLDSEMRDGAWQLLITSPAETLSAIAQLGGGPDGALKMNPAELSTVTATCQGAFASDLPGQIAAALGAHSINVHKMIFSAMSVTVLLDSKDRERAVQSIHDLRPKTSLA